MRPPPACPPPLQGQLLFARGRGAGSAGGSPDLALPMLPRHPSPPRLYHPATSPRLPAGLMAPGAPRASPGQLQLPLQAHQPRYS